MNLKQLKAMVAQQAVKTLIESKLSEVSDTDVTSTGRITQPPLAATKYKTTVDQDMHSDSPSEAVVYHAKKRLANDSQNDSLTDDERNAAAYLSARQSFTPNPQLESAKVNQNDVMEHLIAYIVEPYAGDKRIQPYLKYLESEQQEAAYEKNDEEDSLQAIGGDDLDLVNVDPVSGKATKALQRTSTGVGTVLGRKPRNLKEANSTSTKQIDDTIYSIKMLLKK